LSVSLGDGSSALGRKRISAGEFDAAPPCGSDGGFDLLTGLRPGIGFALAFAVVNVPASALQGDCFRK